MNRALLIAVCDFLILSLLSTGFFEQSLSGGKNGGKATGKPVQEDVIDSLEMILNLKKEEDEHLKNYLQEMEDKLNEAGKETTRLQDDLTALNQKNIALNSLLKSEKDEVTQKAAQVVNIEEEIKKIRESSDILTESLKQEKERSKALQISLAALENNIKEKDEYLAETQNNFTTSLKGVESLSQQVIESQKYTQKLEKQLEDKKIEFSEQMAIHRKELGELQKIKNEQEAQIDGLNRKLSDAIIKETEFRQTLEKLRKDKERLQSETKDMVQAVAQVASESIALQKEKEKRLSPLSNNELFQRFLSYRVKIIFQAEGEKFFSEVSFSEAQIVIPVELKQKKGFLLFYNNSPLKWRYFSSNITDLKLSLKVKEKEYNLEGGLLGVLVIDPRVVFVQIKGEIPGDLEFFLLEEKPFQFDDALLVQTDGDKYGDFNWKLIPGNENFFKVPTSLTSKLFGSFSPSPGDILLSRAGKVLGIMVTGSEALQLKNVDIENIFSVGKIENKEAHKKQYRKWKERLNKVLSVGLD